MEVGDAVPPLLSLCLEKKDAEVRGWRRKTPEVIVPLFSKGYRSRWAMTCSTPKAGRGAVLQQTH